MSKFKRKKFDSTYEKKSKRTDSSPLKKITFHKLDWLETVTMILAFWFLFFPWPYYPLLILLLFIPIMGLILNGLNRPSIASLVTIKTDSKGKNEYDVADFLDIAALSIFGRVLIDFEFDNIGSLIVPGGIASLITLILLFVTHKQIEESNRSRWWIYSSVIFSIFLYSYAATYAINCAFDNSEPTVYKTKVLDKQVSRRRRFTSYKIEVAPWGHHYDKENIHVSAIQYSNISIGDSVNIDLKKGLFGIKWYYIE